MPRRRCWSCALFRKYRRDILGQVPDETFLGLIDKNLLQIKYLEHVVAAKPFPLLRNMLYRIAMDFIATHQFPVEPDDSGQRIDRFLATRPELVAAELSRSRLKVLIRGRSCSRR